MTDGDGLRGQAVSTAVAAVQNHLRFERGLSYALEHALRHGTDLDEISAECQRRQLPVLAMDLRVVMDRWAEVRASEEAS